MRKGKLLLCIILFFLCLVGIYLRRVEPVGYVADQEFFEGQAQGAATSPYDFPVHIMTGQIVSNKPKTPTAAFRLPTNLRCTADAALCEKIKFIGDFSDADKRKYQSLIIRQIKNIDAILTTTNKIQNTLFSLTLDSSNGSRRGWAGSSTITISLGNIKSQEEFLEVLTHELGHVVDLGILQGNKRLVQHLFTNIDHSFFAANDPSLDYYRFSWQNNTTRTRNANALGFVGGYAMSDPFEDFAESFNMYLNHHNVFATLASYDDTMEKKFLYMSKLFRKKYLKADVTTAAEIVDTPNLRPWDSTKGY